MKRQRFCCLICFAQNRDTHLNGKTVKLQDWPKMGSQLLVQWTTSYFLPYQDCHLFQQQFVFNIETNGSVKLFQKTGTVIRYSHDPKWQAMHAGNRCWQILTSRPQETVNQHTIFFRRDVQGGSNARHSRLVTHILLKERSLKRKVMLQKWWHKNGSTAFILISASTEQKRLVTWQQ